MEYSKKQQEDALEYLKEVEVTFQYNRIKYNEFTKLLVDFKQRKIDTGGVIERAKELFKDHTDLILGFNVFLPEEHHITLPPKIKDGLAFLKTVKDAFKDERENYDDFLKILKDWKNQIIDLRSVAARAMELFKENTNLILGFNVFLPTEYQIKFPSQLDAPETTGDQLKVDASHVFRSNNREYHAAVSECNDDFKKKRSKRSNRGDFSSILKSGIFTSKNHEDVVVSGCNEGFEKLTSNKRRRSNTYVDETSLSNGDLKKKITKREAKIEISNKQSKIHNNNNDDDDDDVNDQVQEERPELPLAFKQKIEQMGGSDVMLVIQKKLTMTDMKPNNGRLSIPKNRIINENFLSPTEKLSLDYVRQGNREKRNGMLVSMLDPSLTVYSNMCFKKWKMRTSETYNIMGKWNKLAAKNHLEQDQKVQLWSFGCQHNLWFALVRL